MVMQVATGISTKKRTEKNLLSNLKVEKRYLKPYEILKVIKINT